MQIATDLLIIVSTAGELFGGTTLMTLNDFEPPKCRGDIMNVFWFVFFGCGAHLTPKTLKID